MPRGGKRMNLFKWKSLLKQFPFLPAVLRSEGWGQVSDVEMRAIEREEDGQYRYVNSLHTLLESVRVERADAALMLATGSRSSWSGAAGGTDNYTVYVAVWKSENDWQWKVLDYNEDHDTAGGHDDYSRDGARPVGEQLAVLGVDVDFVVEVCRADSWGQTPRRSVVVHLRTPGLLPQWTRQELHRVADELAAEFARAFGEEVAM
jgi:hypothetical protein